MRHSHHRANTVISDAEDYFAQKELDHVNALSEEEV